MPTKDINYNLSSLFIVFLFRFYKAFEISKQVQFKCVYLNASISFFHCQYLVYFGVY